MNASGWLPASRRGAWSCLPPPGPPPGRGGPDLLGPADRAIVTGARALASAWEHGTSKTGTGECADRAQPSPSLATCLGLPPPTRLAVREGHQPGPINLMVLRKTKWTKVSHVTPPSPGR